MTCLANFALTTTSRLYVDVSLLANGPYTVLNRRDQVKVFSSVKKTFFANFSGRRRISFLRRSWRFSLTDSGDDLSWNASQGRQMKVTFHNPPTEWSMNVHLFSDLSCALVCPWLVFLRTNKFTNLFDHRWRTNRSGSTSARFSGESWSRFIDAFTNKL